MRAWAASRTPLTMARPSPKTTSSASAAREAHQVLVRGDLAHGARRRSASGGEVDARRAAARSCTASRPQRTAAACGGARVVVAALGAGRAATAPSARGPSRRRRPAQRSTVTMPGEQVLGAARQDLERLRPPGGRRRRGRWARRRRRCRRWGPSPAAACSPSTQRRQGVIFGPHQQGQAVGADARAVDPGDARRGRRRRSSRKRVSKLSVPSSTRSASRTRAGGVVGRRGRPRCPRTAHLGVDPPQLRLRGHGLGQAPRRVLLVEQRLALQVRVLDEVAIDER